MSKFVQHISGLGKKFEVVNDDEWYFLVREPGTFDHFSFPVSDYRLCDEPEKEGA